MLRNIVNKSTQWNVYGIVVSTVEKIEVQNRPFHCSKKCSMSSSAPWIWGGG